MKQRLLIAEDDRLLAEAAGDYFTGKGWDVHTAENGDRALELSLPSEGALLSFEQLRPMTPGALHTGPPILKPRDAIYYSQQRWIWILSARGWCLPRVERTPGDPR